MLTHLHNGSASETKLFSVEEIRLSRSAQWNSRWKWDSWTVGSFPRCFFSVLPADKRRLTADDRFFVYHAHTYCHHVSI